MTEKSFAWNCEPAVGDFSPYTLEIVEATQRIMGNINPLNAGVVYWTDPTVFPAVTNPTIGLLEPSFVSGNTVRITTGIGMVQGWVYLNDANVDTNVSGGAANATDIIGLRRDLTGQTVRLFYGRGPAGFLYPLVQTPTIWEIPLAQIGLDGAGNFASILDVREFVRSPNVYGRKAFVSANYGRNNGADVLPSETDKNTVTISAASSLLVPTSTGQDGYVEANFTIPKGRISGLNFRPIIRLTENFGPSIATVKYRLAYNTWITGTFAETGTLTVSAAPTQVIKVTDWWETSFGSFITVADSEPVLLMRFIRNGLNGGDDGSNCQVMGFEVAWNEIVPSLNGNAPR